MQLTDISTNFFGAIVPLIIFRNKPLFFSSLILKTRLLYLALYLLPTSLLQKTYKSCSIVLTRSSNLSSSILTSVFLLSFSVKASVKPLIRYRSGYFGQVRHASDFSLYYPSSDLEQPCQKNLKILIFKRSFLIVKNWLNLSKKNLIKNI